MNTNSHLIMLFDIKLDPIMKTLFLTLITLLGLTSISHADHANGTITADVDGLVCDFCARAVEKVFLKQAAVDNININLDDKKIKIHLKDNQSMDEEVVKKLIVDSGYSVKAINYES